MKMIEFQSIASGSSGNCYLISDGHTKIMLEAGISIREIKKALNFNISGVDGLLISHSHGDHSKSVKDMLKLGVDCYMLQSTAEEIKADHNRVKFIEPKKQFKIGTLTILPFDTQHDVEAVGFLIQSKDGDKFLFITDSYYCKYKFKGLNIIAIEANYSLPILDANIEIGRVHAGMRKRLLKSHFSLENVKEFFKANDLSSVEEIYLLHLSDSNSDEALFKEEIQKVTGKPVYIC